MNGTSWPDIIGVGRQFTGQFHKDPLYPQPARAPSGPRLSLGRQLGQPRAAHCPQFPSILSPVVRPAPTIAFLDAERTLNGG